MVPTESETYFNDLLKIPCIFVFVYKKLGPACKVIVKPFDTHEISLFWVLLCFIILIGWDIFRLGLITHWIHLILNIKWLYLNSHLRLYTHLPHPQHYIHMYHKQHHDNNCILLILSLPGKNKFMETLFYHPSTSSYLSDIYWAPHETF